MAGSLQLIGKSRSSFAVSPWSHRLKQKPHATIQHAPPYLARACGLLLAAGRQPAVRTAAAAPASPAPRHAEGSWGQGVALRTAHRKGDMGRLLAELPRNSIELRRRFLLPFSFSPGKQAFAWTCLFYLLARERLHGVPGYLCHSVVAPRGCTRRGVDLHTAPEQHNAGLYLSLACLCPLIRPCRSPGIYVWLPSTFLCSREHGLVRSRASEWCGGLQDMLITCTAEPLRNSTGSGRPGALSTFRLAWCKSNLWSH